MTDISRFLHSPITKGIDFLYNSQLPYGEFPCYRTDREQGDGHWHFDSSIFITSLIAYSLRFIHDKKSREMIIKAKHFLLKEMHPMGLWQYCSSRNKHKLLPDLDDTCCASEIIREKGTGDVTDDLFIILNNKNRNIILNNRDDKGLFYTWIKPGTYRENDIDSVVNGNVLFYLKQFEGVGSVIDYLYSIILNNREEASYWSYTSNSSLYYIISRAYENGASRLHICSDIIKQKIMEKHFRNSSFHNDLETALDVCALINLDFRGFKAMEPAIEYLISRQKDNGAWLRTRFMAGPPPPAPISVWYGSEMATTGFCIEALAKYSSILLNCS